MRRLEPSSAHAIVTDPPAGIGFMGRAWDSKRGYQPRTERGAEVAPVLGGLGLEAWAAGFVVFMVDAFTEVRRVAKPGAHCVAWALPRTADLSTLALRLAGWEIRDSVIHLFGGGFPKSHSVSKMIDKRRPEDPRLRMVCRWIRSVMESRGVSSRTVAARFGFDPRMADHWAARDTDSQPSTPRLDQVADLFDVLGVTEPPASITNAIFALNDAKGTPGPLWWERQSSRTPERMIAFHPGEDRPTRAGNPSRDIAASEEAARWDGWGTALSPGHEQWLLARKPLGGTVAECALEHGTGGLNIAASLTRTEDSGPLTATIDGRVLGDHPPERPRNGRWPKNAVLSCAVGCVGRRHSPGCPVRELEAQHSDAPAFYPRFAFVPKASDRGVPGRPDLTNAHPTHKSVQLMRWLLRLITPPGGIVLDPFMGSGTTGVACVAERVGFVGIEASPEHHEVATARIWGAVGSPEAAARANEHAGAGHQLGLL
jgi:DNA modification methylase